MNGVAAIDRFGGEYRWLSNFAPVTLVYDGCLYASVEHAYQAAKTSDEREKWSIRKCITAVEAKRLGRQVTMRPDWERVKQNVMLKLLRLKFKRVPYRALLLATGDAELIEGNGWGDTYWGVCNGKGENRLGKLIMQVRAELASKTAKDMAL